MSQKQAQQSTQNRPRSHSKILIIGGGDAGVSTVRMFKKCPNVHLSQVKVIEPSKVYHYQSLQTAVGGGLLPGWMTFFSNRYLYPKVVQRVYFKVAKVVPEENYVVCEDGSEHSYDVLILAAGLQLRGDKVKGLMEAMADPNIPVASNYWLEYSEKFNRLASDFKGGEALFTQPSTVIKCGGAPQKIMYLSCSRWNDIGPYKRNIKYTPHFYTATKSLFGVPYYRVPLEKVAANYNCNIHTEHDLVEVDGQNKEAVFKNLESGEIVRKKFDILHVTPPQAAAPFISEAGLANTDGFVLVDKETLQSPKFPNVFAIGDCASLPTSKTASTLNEQAYVLYSNVMSYLNGKPLTERYDGYTACPVFVGRGKILLCEFGYDNRILKTFPFDNTKPSYFSYFLKMVAIPASYVFCGPKFVRNCRHKMIGFNTWCKGLRLLKK